MNIFDELNEKFFTPLTGKYKSLYFDCVNILIERRKEVSLFYDSEMKDCLTIFLKNSDYQISGEDDEIISENKIDTSKIIRKFRECGWIGNPELAGNGEYFSEITSHCRKIIELLNKFINQKSTATLSNNILSMNSILKDCLSAESVRAERPYATVIEPLIENKTELYDELNILENSIGIIIDKVVDFNDANSLGNFLINDSSLEKFFRDYFFIKRKGLIQMHISEISKNLTSFRGGEFFDKSIKEYMDLYSVSEDEATNKISNYISELQYFIDIEYQDNMDRIDKKIRKYYSIANMRLKFVTSSGLDLESSIDKMLNFIKESNEEKRLAISDSLSTCLNIYDLRYIGTKSFAIRKRNTSSQYESVLSDTDLSEEEKKLLSEELFRNSYNAYSIEKVNTYFDSKLKNPGDVILSKDVKTKEDALMFISAIIYTGQSDFEYQVDFNDKSTETPLVTISNLRIRRKKQ